MYRISTFYEYSFIFLFILWFTLFFKKLIIWTQNRKNNLDGETEDKFYYLTDGYIDVFGFGDIMLWNSEMDDRKFIEDKNDYEDFKPYITKLFNNYVEKMHRLSL